MFLATLALAGSQPAFTAPKEKTIYDFSAENIDGKKVKLSKFKGKVLMIVNVASKCGNTPQYAVLEKLYADYKSKGLVILGFPANDFNSQEPGTNAEIKQFCTETYKVDFPMFAKTEVKGDAINPIYTWLIAHSDTPTEPIHWNFEKFIVDRQGNVVKRVAPRTQPNDPDVLATIDAALAK